MASEKSFSKILFTPEVNLINLNIDGKAYLTIFQETQFHPVTDRLLHVDFLEVLPGKPVTIAIPVKLEGVSQGVLRGGRLVKKLRKVMIKALSEDLPDHVTINISALEIGDSVKISDLKAPNVTFLESPTSVVVGVQTARQVVEEVVPGAEAAAEGTEGEKAEEGKKEEGKKEEKGK